MQATASQIRGTARVSRALTLMGLFIFINTASAQTTSFTYQGKLNTSGTPATGNYDFEFRLFDALSNGTQVGATQTVTNVAVANGIFTVQLDFGACDSCFNGSPRFLDITVRPTGGGAFTPLAPRQPITSTPYAIKTQNLTVNGSFNDGTTILAAANTFAGDGAGLNTAPDPSPFGGAGKFNSFFGGNAGKANVTGILNSFFGTAAGSNNTGGSNSFFGAFAGAGNTTGGGNTFFGSSAGLKNTSGDDNAFFGRTAGTKNTTGAFNAFFGTDTGSNNTAGNSNAFFGNNAGSSNTTGSNNTFFGPNAGVSNQAGNSNTGIGELAGFTATNTTGNGNLMLGASSKATANLSNQTAIGAFAMVTQSDSMVLGSISGLNGATADTRVGIGVTAPAFKLQIFDPTNTGLRVENLNPGGTVASFGGFGAFLIDATGVVGGRLIVTEGGNVGIGAPGATERLDISGTGVVRARINSNSNAGMRLALGNQAKWSLATVTGGHFQIFNDVTSQSAMWIDSTNNNLGLGTTSPTNTLDIFTNSGHLILGDAGCSAGFTGIGFASSLSGCINYSLLGNGTDTIINRPIGGTISFREANTGQVSIAPGGIITINSLPANSSLCTNFAKQLVGCVSSLRYKTDVQSFLGGLEIVKRLRPISFTWKESGSRDIGFGAEEVAKVEPLFTFKNDRGEVEGVKYDRVSVVLVNAIKEQQAQITNQQKLLEKQAARIDSQQLFIEQQERKFTRQQQQLEALQKLICSTHRKAKACK